MDNVVQITDYFKLGLEVKTDETFVINTIIVPRDEGDVEGPIHINEDQSLCIQLNGYAIVPIEEYCGLKGIHLEASIMEDIERTQQKIKRGTLL